MLAASVAAAARRRRPGRAATTAVVTAPAQTIAGFGASGAWWVNDLKKFSSSVQSQVASLLFTTSGIDLSQYRYNIGGGGVGVTVAARAPQSLPDQLGHLQLVRTTRAASTSSRPPPPTACPT